MPAKCREAPLPDQGVTFHGVTSRSHQRELPLLHRSYWLMRQTKILSLTWSPYFKESLAGCHQSLLEIGPSRRYLCNPCIGAWTLTPRVFLWCICSLLPKERRPHVRSETFGTSGLPLQGNFYRARFFGAAVIPLCSGSHCSLGLQVAPTAEVLSPSGRGQAVYTTQWTYDYPHELWHHYVSETSN